MNRIILSNTSQVALKKILERLDFSKMLIFSEKGDLVALQK
jgi:hypothetical protein